MKKYQMVLGFQWSRLLQGLAFLFLVFVYCTGPAEARSCRVDLIPNGEVNRCSNCHVNPPGGESLKDTAARTLPFFMEHIIADLDRGENIIVAAHGNSLRSIVMHLDKLSRDEVLQLNIGTGVPILYQLGPGGAVSSKRILT